MLSLQPSFSFFKQGLLIYPRLVLICYVADDDLELEFLILPPLPLPPSPPPPLTPMLVLKVRVTVSSLCSSGGEPELGSCYASFLPTQLHPSPVPLSLLASLFVFFGKIFSNIVWKILLLHHLQVGERRSGGVFCRGPAGRVCSRKGVVWVGEYGALARVNLTDLASLLH